MLRHRWKILIGLATAFVLVTVTEVVTIGIGPKKALEAYKKSLIAKGERLEISELLPPQAPLNKTNIIDEALNLLTPADFEESNSIPAMFLIGPGKGIVCFKQPGVRDLYFTNSWANEMTAAEHDRPMAELLKQVMTHPAIDYHWDYNQGLDKQMEEENQYAIPLGVIVQRLSAAAMCDLHRGDASSSATNIYEILTMMHAEKEMHFISLYDRVETSIAAADASWELLQASNLKDQELALLQRNWEHVEFIRPLENELEIDRAMIETEIAKMRASDDYLDKTMHRYYENPNWSDDAKVAYDKFMYRASWTYSDELSMLQKYQIILQTVRTVVTNQFFDPAYSNMIEQLKTEVTDDPAETPLKLDDYGWGLFIGADGASVSVVLTMHAEVIRRIVITAIALKRYQLKYGKYPSSLADLAPRFVSSIPRDPVDGKPLRYRLMPNGTFLLYSTGENDRDDGGDASLRKEVPYSNQVWFDEDRLDWVWPQPATAAEVQHFYAHLPRP